jgi:hypothetical protein
LFVAAASLFVLFAPQALSSDTDNSNGKTNLVIFFKR